MNDNTLLRKKSLFLWMLCLLFSFLTFGKIQAQDIITVSGTVTGVEDQMPLVSVNVIEKGTSNGAMTNFDGEYSLQISNAMLL